MKILIIGGYGLFGLNCALALKKEHKIFLSYNSRNPDLSNTTKVFIDLNSFENLNNSLKNLSPDIVFYAAGITSVEQCELNPQLAWKVNVKYSEKVAKICAGLGIKMIHISTDHLFDGQFQMYDEQSLTKPLNVYAKTKEESENRVLNVFSDALVIRTNFFGWGTTYRYSFSDFIISNLRLKNKINLFQDVYYTPILIEVLVKIIMKLIENRENGIFNVVSNERISKYDFGQIISKVFSLDSTLINKARMSNSSNLVKRPGDMSLSNVKATTRLNIKIESIEEQVLRLYNQEFSDEFKEIRKL